MENYITEKTYPYYRLGSVWPRDETKTVTDWSQRTKTAYPLQPMSGN
jgi:hypothetical protein